jgi:hypothetical protein
MLVQPMLNLLRVAASCLGPEDNSGYALTACVTLVSLSLPFPGI